MSVDLAASSTHGNVDEQIGQLMQCKPLSEPEVLLFLSPPLSIRAYLRIVLRILQLRFILTDLYRRCLGVRVSNRNAFRTIRICTFTYLYARIFVILGDFLFYLCGGSMNNRQCRILGLCCRFFLFMGL